MKIFVLIAVQCHRYSTTACQAKNLCLSIIQFLHHTHGPNQSQAYLNNIKMVRHSAVQTRAKVLISVATGVSLINIRLSCRLLQHQIFILQFHISEISGS